MNLKKSVAGLIAGFALLGTLAAPAAMAQESGTASVTVTDNGVFNAYFCVPNDINATHTTTYTLAQQSAPTATSAGLATGSLALCYTDTKSYRPNFDVNLQATNFTDGSHTIAASNFKVTFTSGIGQTQWSSQNPPTTSGIGDLGYFINEGYVAQGAGGSWNTNNQLNTARRVHFGYAGRGTVLSGGRVDVALTLPSGTSAGTYTSSLTLSIVAGTQP